MMDRLSVNEFKAYCNDNKITEISFSTENQDWYKAADPFKIQMSFEIVLTSEFPSLVFLKSNAGTICLDRVRYVEIDSEKIVTGTVVHVYCGGRDFDHPEITYTLIAS